MFCGTNLIFQKNFVPDIWAKIFSSNQIPGLFNEPYHEDKLIKEPDSLHVDAISGKLKVIFEWTWSKMSMVRS